MSYDDLAEGATKAAISWGEEKIKELARKFKDKQIAFIQDEKTILLVKNQLKKGEWALCAQYIKNSDMRLLVQMGLTLRALESNGDRQALQNLRDKIVGKYGTNGLYIAQFVQCKILSEFIGSVANKAVTVNELAGRVENLLSNVPQYVIFIKNENNSKSIVRKIETKINAIEPDTIILFSAMSAVTVCREVKRILQKNLDENYYMEIKEESDRMIIFLFKREKDLSQL